MTSGAKREYRFETPAQWGACLFVHADRNARDVGLRPFAPLERSATLHGPPYARAPAVSTHGDVVWRSGERRLLRMSAAHEEPEAFTAPESVATANRIVVNARGMW